MSFFRGFHDELEKTARISKDDVLMGLAFFGLLGAGNLAMHYGINKAMEGINSISPRLGNTIGGAGGGAAIQALLNKGRVTKGPVAVGALGGALYPEISKGWQEL